MLEELKRNSSIGTGECVDRFVQLVFEDKVFGLEALEHSFRYHSLVQFNCHIAILFFEDLGLFKTSKKEVVLTEQGVELSLLSPEVRKLKISEIVLKRLLENNFISYKNITIDSLTGELKIPMNAFSLSGAIYRNYLYESGCFTQNSSYLILKNRELSNRVESRIIDDKRRISQQELLKKIQKQQEDGDAGELFVLNYEIRRLSSSTLSPRRVSAVDVGAGYDILSCEDTTSLQYDRYIEVKSFRGNPHFYWSLNEKSVAEVLKSQYFIYLIDLNKMEKDPHSYVPFIIQNPAEELTNDKWYVEANSFQISLIQ